MCNLGLCYEQGDGVKEDKPRALELYIQSGERGNTAAQCNAGYCYLTGIGCEADPEKAISWFERAASGGSVRALDLLGDCYRDGKGVAQDKRRAMELYRKAAAEGNEDSAESLKKLEAELGSEAAHTASAPRKEPDQKPKEKKGFFGKLFGK